MSSVFPSLTFAGQFQTFKVSTRRFCIRFWMSHLYWIVTILKVSKTSTVKDSTRSWRSPRPHLCWILTDPESLPRLYLCCLLYSRPWRGLHRPQLCNFFSHPEGLHRPHVCICRECRQENVWMHAEVCCWFWLINLKKYNNNQHRKTRYWRRPPQEKYTSRNVNDKCLRTLSIICFQVWLQWNLLGVLQSGPSPWKAASWLTFLRLGLSAHDSTSHDLKDGCAT